MYRQLAFGTDCFTRINRNVGQARSKKITKNRQNEDISYLHLWQDGFDLLHARFMIMQLGAEKLQNHVGDLVLFAHEIEQTRRNGVFDVLHAGHRNFHFVFRLEENR